MKKLLSMVAMILAVAPFSFGGAWTQPKGSTYQRFSLNLFQSHADYAPGGESFDLNFGGRFQDLNFTWYLEWGVSDRLTLVSSIPFKELNSSGDFHDVTERGIGDIEAGVRYRLLEGPLILSTQAMLKLPWAYEQSDFMSLGNGEIEAELRFLGGMSLPAARGYAGLELAYRYRDGGPADEFRYLVEFGSGPYRGFSARAKLDGIVSIGNGTFDQFLFNIRSNDEFDLVKIELTLSFVLTKKMSLEVTWTPTLSGRSTAKGETYTIAFVLIGR